MRRFWQKAVLVFGFWTLIALSFASQFYISSSQAGLAVTWRQAVLSSLADWYVFALLSWPVIVVSRRFRLEGRLWLPHSIAHLGFSLGFSLGYILLRSAVGELQGGRAGFGELFRGLLFKTWHYNILIYWVMVSVNHAFDYYRKYQERALRAAELEKRLAQARLQALQMQLNPHFLFNTLHAISTLMHKDVEAADRMIAKLGELLRYALESTDEHVVPLEQELAFLRRYLEIEQTRFGERLRVRFEIEPAALSALVPNLILQPMVENALKHGIEKRSRPGEVVLRAGLENGQIHLSVEDDGPGLSEGKLTREGVGVSNTRSRLAQLYGDQGHKFAIANRREGGVRVAMSFPANQSGLPGAT